MTEWIAHRWYGPAALVEQARLALPTDAAVIGALIPPLEYPLRVLDGDAAISFAALEHMPVPEGLRDDKPELISVLHGTVA